MRGAQRGQQLVVVAAHPGRAGGQGAEHAGQLGQFLAQLVGDAGIRGGVTGQNGRQFGEVGRRGSGGLLDGCLG